MAAGWSEIVSPPVTICGLIYRLTWKGRGGDASSDCVGLAPRHVESGAHVTSAVVEFSSGSSFCRGGRARAHLRRAKDPWLSRAAAAYQDAGYHDGMGGDRSPAVRWWVRWARSRGESMVRMASPLDGSAAQRRVEDSLILFVVWLVDVSEGCCCSDSKRVREHHACVACPALRPHAT